MRLIDQHPTYIDPQDIQGSLGRIALYVNGFNSWTVKTELYVTNSSADVVHHTSHADAILDFSSRVCHEARRAKDAKAGFTPLNEYTVLFQTQEGRLLGAVVYACDTLRAMSKAQAALELRTPHHTVLVTEGSDLPFVDYQVIVHRDSAWHAIRQELQLPNGAATPALR